jgi:hypothetical protein
VRRWRGGEEERAGKREEEKKTKEKRIDQLKLFGLVWQVCFSLSWFFLNIFTKLFEKNETVSKKINKIIKVNTIK